MAFCGAGQWTASFLVGQASLLEKLQWSNIDQQMHPLLVGYETLNPTYHERKGQTSKGFWGMLEEEGGKWIQLLGRRSERDHLRAANGFTEMTPILDA